MNPLELITALRNTDGYIETIFLKGGCYQLHLFLIVIFPYAVPLINAERDHVISKIGQTCYDITGEVSGTGYSYLDQADLELVKTWSFSKKALLSLGECQFCEEPILIDGK